MFIFYRVPSGMAHCRSDLAISPRSFDAAGLQFRPPFSTAVAFCYCSQHSRHEEAMSVPRLSCLEGDASEGGSLLVELQPWARHYWMAWILNQNDEKGE